jgi:hypothetical protein
MSSLGSFDSMPDLVEMHLADLKARHSALFPKVYEPISDDDSCDDIFDADMIAQLSKPLDSPKPIDLDDADHEIAAFDWPDLPELDRPLLTPVEIIDDSDWQCPTCDLVWRRRDVSSVFSPSLQCPACSLTGFTDDNRRRLLSSLDLPAPPSLPTIADEPRDEWMVTSDVEEIPEKRTPARISLQSAEFLEFLAGQELWFADFFAYLKTTASKWQEVSFSLKIELTPKKDQEQNDDAKEHRRLGIWTQELDHRIARGEFDHLQRDGPPTPHEIRHQLNHSPPMPGSWTRKAADISYCTQP